MVNVYFLALVIRICIIHSSRRIVADSDVFIKDDCIYVQGSFPLTKLK